MAWRAERKYKQKDDKVNKELFTRPEKKTFRYHLGMEQSVSARGNCRKRNRNKRREEKL